MTDLVDVHTKDIITRFLDHESETEAEAADS